MIETIIGIGIAAWVAFCVAGFALMLLFGIGWGVLKDTGDPFKAVGIQGFFWCIWISIAYLLGAPIPTYIAYPAIALVWIARYSLYLIIASAIVVIPLVLLWEGAKWIKGELYTNKETQHEH